MFAELLAHPGVTETYVPGSTFGIMAFHGGSLERMTDVIASEIAQRCGATLYTVCQPDRLRWHVPSKLFDPAASTRLAAFVDHVDTAIAIHGFGRASMFTTLLVGGSNRMLAEELAISLRAGLTFGDTEYSVIDHVGDIPVELRGLHPDNPVNLPRLGGVQLELPPRVRGLGPHWDGRDAAELTPHTDGLIDAVVRVARSWCETHTP